MSVFERKPGEWVSKFQHQKKQCWTRGGPWPTRDEAEKAEREYRAQLTGRLSDETAASFADRWIREWPRKAMSTRKLYADSAQRFADEFGDIPLQEVGRVAARTWSLGVPRNVSKNIASMYEDARDLELVTTNPFAHLRLLKSEQTREVAPPTIAEFHTLLRSCVLAGAYAKELRAMITFTAWTGLRASEVQGLQWPDIDGDFIHVRRARKDDGSYGKPKGDKVRTIPLLEPARVLDQVPRRAGCPFVFHTPRGMVLKKGNMYHHWNKVRAPLNLERKEDGQPDVVFHGLRHFCATQLLELGLSHYDVSVQLGHDDGGALVMSRYGHPSKDKARERLLAAFTSSPAVMEAVR